MQIRLITINDYEDVYKIWLSCKGIGLNSLDDSKDGIEKFLKRNPETCFVAIEESEIVGSILVGNDGRRGYIYISYSRKPKLSKKRYRQKIS